MQAVITRTSHRKPSGQNNFVVANELSLQNSLVTKYEKKLSKSNDFESFLDLLPRFELGASSLPTGWEHSGP